MSNLLQFGGPLPTNTGVRLAHAPIVVGATVFGATDGGRLGCWVSPFRWVSADVAQLVAHHLAKVRVAGSSPVVRSEHKWHCIQQ